jgi:hypothetical protein
MKRDCFGDQVALSTKRREQPPNRDTCCHRFFLNTILQHFASSSSIPAVMTRTTLLRIHIDTHCSHGIDCDQLHENVMRETSCSFCALVNTCMNRDKNISNWNTWKLLWLDPSLLSLEKQSNAYESASDTFCCSYFTSYLHLPSPSIYFDFGQDILSRVSWFSRRWCCGQNRTRKFEET